MIELLVLAAFILSLNAFVRARRATERVERDLQAVKEELAALRAAGGFPAGPAAPVAPAVPADVALVSSEAAGEAAVAPTLHDASAEAGDAPLRATPVAAVDAAGAESVASTPSARAAADEPAARPDAAPDETAPSQSPPGSALETLIGGRWAVWVGGVALALGGIFLVKVSIDAGLLGPGPRLIMASLFGLALFAAGEWVRRRLRLPAGPEERAGAEGGAADPLGAPGPASSMPTATTMPAPGRFGNALIPGILTAAGAVTLLGAIFAAHGIYGFIGPGFAFTLMAMVSLSTIALSLLHGQAIAGLGLAASLITPALVSSQDSSPEALFGFLAVAWLAALAAARIGRWRIVPVLGNLGLGLWSLAYLVSADVVEPTPLTLAMLVLVAGLAVLWPAGADEAETVRVEDAAGSATAPPAPDAGPVPGAGLSRLFTGARFDATVEKGAEDTLADSLRARFQRARSTRSERAGPAWSARHRRVVGGWWRLFLPRHGWIILSGALVVLVPALGFLTPDLLAERDPNVDSVLLIAALAGLAAWRGGAGWAGIAAGLGAVLATLIAASTPALNLPVDLTIAPGGPLEPSGEGARPIAFTLSAVFILLCGLAVHRRRARPGPSLTFFAALTALVAIACPSVTFLMIGLFGVDPVHGGVALAMAAALLGLAAFAGPASRGAQAWLLAGALAQLVLAAHALTEDLSTTLSIAAVAALFAIAGKRLAWPALPWMTVLGLLAILGRIALDPSVVGAAALSTRPILNALLPGYGLPALVALASAWAYRASPDLRLRNVLQGLASLLVLLTLAILVRHAMNGGRLEGGLPSLGEQAIYTLLLIGGSGIMMRLDLSSPSSVLRYGSLALGAFSILSVLSAHLVGLNPYWTGEPLGRFPVVDLLLLGYLLPALAYAALARFARGRRPGPYVAALSIAAGMLGFAWATLSVRRAWQGQGIADWKGFLPGETYSYSVVWLVLGVALLALSTRFGSVALRIASAVLVVLTVLKVFLVDMANLEGLLRALSFIGLGAVLIGIGLFYQKILLRPRPGARP